MMMMMMMLWAKFHWAAALIRSWPGPGSCSNGPSSNSQWLSSALHSADYAACTVHLLCNITVRHFSVKKSYTTRIFKLTAMQCRHCSVLHSICIIKMPFIIQSISIQYIWQRCVHLWAFDRASIWWIALRLFVAVHCSAGKVECLLAAILHDDQIPFSHED